MLHLAAKFCHKCGEKWEMHCKKCSANLKEDFKFCPDCGFPVHAVHQGSSANHVAEKKCEIEGMNRIQTQLWGTSINL